MLAGLCALVALLALGYLWTTRAPRLTDDQVRSLVDEYLIAEALDDDVRAHEIWRDLRCEGVTLRCSAGGVTWERG
jgi:hypothetical protein